MVTEDTLLDTLEHMLGLSHASNRRKKKPKPYRNYYSGEHETLEAMTKEGYVYKRNAPSWSGDRVIYHVTEKGFIKVLGEEYYNKHKQELEEL